jgi:hypothetical protein
MEETEENNLPQSTHKWLLVTLFGILFLVLIWKLWSPNKQEVYPVVKSVIDLPDAKGQAVRYRFSGVTWANALHWLAHPKDLEGQPYFFAFTNQVIEILRTAPYRHFTFDASVDLKQPFEFVLVNEKWQRIAADPSIFAREFSPRKLDNLDNDTLTIFKPDPKNPTSVTVTPIPLPSQCLETQYLDLATFVRGCSTTQSQHLLQQLAVACFQTAPETAQGGKISIVSNKLSRSPWVAFTILLTTNTAV